MAEIDHPDKNLHSHTVITGYRTTYIEAQCSVFSVKHTSSVDSDPSYTCSFANHSSPFVEVVIAFDSCLSLVVDALSLTITLFEVPTDSFEVSTTIVVIDISYFGLVKGQVTPIMIKSDLHFTIWIAIVWAIIA